MINSIRQFSPKQDGICVTFFFDKVLKQMMLKIYENLRTAGLNPKLFSTLSLLVCMQEQ